MGRSRRPHPPGRRVMVEQAPRRPPSGLGRRRMVPLDGRGVMALGRWRVVPLWRVAFLLPPVRPILLMMEVLDLSVEPQVLVVIVHGLVRLVVISVLGFGCGKAGVDVLGDQVELLELPSGDAGLVRLFERAVLVESTTDEDCAVRQLGGTGPEAADQLPILRPARPDAPQRVTRRIRVLSHRGPPQYRRVPRELPLGWSTCRP